MKLELILYAVFAVLCGLGFLAWSSFDGMSELLFLLLGLICVVALLVWTLDIYVIGLVFTRLLGFVLRWDVEKRARINARFERFNEQSMDWSKIGSGQHKKYDDHEQP